MEARKKCEKDSYQIDSIDSIDPQPKMIQNAL